MGAFTNVSYKIHLRLFHVCIYVQCIVFNTYAAGNLIDQYKMMQKTLRNDWSPDTWVLIWEYSPSAIRWM